jgi:DNA-binding transcriptional regulator YdaS (Cro superfamily)
MKNNSLDRAIEHFGSQARLAEALDVEPMAVTHWKSRGVPPKRAIQIEEATEGSVTRFDLLPELFGAPIAGDQAA